MIPIKEVIKAFEKALKDYKSVDLGGSYFDIEFKFKHGLCNYLTENGKQKLKAIFCPILGHYKNYLIHTYLFNTPFYIYHFANKEWQKGITDRIEFLEREIPYLKGLMKKGYTHI